jgi:DNA ligase (NAD+)
VLKSYFSSLGAKITDSVTKKTTILLVGSDPGSKVSKAQELGINIFASVDEIKQAFGI